MFSNNFFFIILSLRGVMIFILEHVIHGVINNMKKMFNPNCSVTPWDTFRLKMRSILKCVFF